MAEPLIVYSHVFPFLLFTGNAADIRLPFSRTEDLFVLYHSLITVDPGVTLNGFKVQRPSWDLESKFIVNLVFSQSDTLHDLNLNPIVLAITNPGCVSPSQNLLTTTKVSTPQKVQVISTSTVSPQRSARD